MNLGTYVFLFLALLSALLLLGAGFLAGVLASETKQEMLENAGVAARTAPPQVETLSNRARIARATGIQERDLRSEHYSRNDNVFWFGVHEWVVLEDGMIIQRTRGQV